MQANFDIQAYIDRVRDAIRAPRRASLELRKVGVDLGINEGPWPLPRGHELLRVVNTIVDKATDHLDGRSRTTAASNARRQIQRLPWISEGAIDMVLKENRAHPYPRVLNALLTAVKEGLDAGRRGLALEQHVAAAVTRTFAELAERAEAAKAARQDPVARIAAAVQRLADKEKIPAPRARAIVKILKGGRLTAEELAAIQKTSKKNRRAGKTVAAAAAVADK